LSEGWTVMNHCAQFVRVIASQFCSGEFSGFERELGAWSDLGGRTDGFDRSFPARITRPVAPRSRKGRIDITINSGELNRSIAGAGSDASSCCEAMQEEFKTGDALILDRTNGAGMTVRYFLPRTVRSN
jgi:hypothetical protein